MDSVEDIAKCARLVTAGTPLSLWARQELVRLCDSVHIADFGNVGEAAQSIQHIRGVLRVSGFSAGSFILHELGHHIKTLSFDANNFYPASGARFVWRRPFVDCNVLQLTLLNAGRVAVNICAVAKMPAVVELALERSNLSDRELKTDTVRAKGQRT